MRRSRPLALVAALALLAPLLTHDTARAEIIERVVAIVGDSPILYSELQQRSRPFMLKILASVPMFQQKVAVGEMQKELLGKLVDERVVAVAADKLGVGISTKEIDDSIKLKAADLKITVSQLVSEAGGQGLSELDYREEVRRELLFSKMLETRMRSRPRVTEDDTREYYKKLQMQERRTQTFRAVTLTIALPKDAAPTKAARARKLADSFVRQARAGKSMNELAATYASDGVQASALDTGTAMAYGAFGKPMDDAVARLDTGEVSEPFVAGTALTIVKVTERQPSQIPPYAEVRDVVASRVRAWLDELKRGVHIEVRL